MNESTFFVYSRRAVNFLCVVAAVGDCSVDNVAFGIQFVMNIIYTGCYRPPNVSHCSRFLHLITQKQVVEEWWEATSTDCQERGDDQDNKLLNCAF